MPTSKRGVNTPVIVSDHLVTVTKHLRLYLAAHTKVHNIVHEKISLDQASQIALPALMVTLMNSTKIKSLKITLFSLFIT